MFGLNYNSAVNRNQPKKVHEYTLESVRIQCWKCKICIKYSYKCRNVRLKCHNITIYPLCELPKLDFFSEIYHVRGVICTAKSTRKKTT